MEEAALMKIVAAILTAGMLSRGERKGEAEAVRLYHDLHHRLSHGEPHEQAGPGERGEFHTPWR